MARDLGSGLVLVEAAWADSLGVTYAGTLDGGPVHIRLVASDAGGLRRLARARGVLTGLHSRYLSPCRHIVVVRDADVAGPTLALVSAPPPGPDRAVELYGGSLPSAAQAARLGAGVALGLVALHAAGLAHGGLALDLLRFEGDPLGGVALPTARLGGVGVRWLSAGTPPEQSADVRGLADLVSAALEATGGADDRLSELLGELGEENGGATARDAATRLAACARLASSAGRLATPRPAVAVAPRRPAAKTASPASADAQARVAPPPSSHAPSGEDAGRRSVTRHRARRRGLGLMAVVVVLLGGLAGVLIRPGSPRPADGASAGPLPGASAPTPAAPLLTEDLAAQTIAAAQIGRAARPLENVGGLNFNSLLPALAVYCDHYTPAASTQTGHSFVGYSSGIGINIYDDVSTYTGSGAGELIAGVRHSLQQCPVLMPRDDAGNVLGTFTVSPVNPLAGLPASQVGLLYQRTDKTEPAVQAVFLQKGDHVIVVLARGQNTASLRRPLDRLAIQALAKTTP